MGDDGLRELALRSAETAAGYGFSISRHVAQYVQLALALGRRFDCDALLPWASTILRSQSAAAAEKKMHRLNAAAFEYVDAVAGWNGRQYRRAILRMRCVEYGRFPSLGRAPAKELMPWLMSIFPEKARHAADFVPVFVELAALSARRFELGEGRPFAVYATLMFLLGYGFSDDPQFPWAREVLREGAGDAPDRTARALTVAGHAWIERVLSLSGRA